jgi:hypothetical protein
MCVDRAPACYAYIVRQMQGGVPHGRSGQQQHRVHEEGDVTWRSNKMPLSLLRHEINEPPPNIPCMELNSANGAGNREQPLADAEFDTDFVNSDMDEDVVFNEVTGEHQVKETDGDGNLCGNLQNNMCRRTLAYTTDQKWTIALLKVLDMHSSL